MNAILTRRELLRRGLFCAGYAATAPLLWACGADGNGDDGGPITSNYRVPPLRSQTDANGLLLPEGFSSRVIGESLMLISGTSFLLPLPFFPDGAATFPDPEMPGGWILLVNSEVPNLVALPGLPLLAGGVYGIRFAPGGAITGAYRALGGSNTNCAGGQTPWGTWISCEEVDGGTSYEVHPLGEGNFGGVSYPIRLDSLGIFKHEAAAVDPVARHIYLTEDQGDGRLYRFIGEDNRPWDGSVKIDLTQGRMQVAQVLGDDAGLSRQVVWHDLPNPQSQPTRQQVAASTPFDGGEGCFYRAGIVYFTTKGDNRVWAYDTRASLLDVIYDDEQFADPVLTGVDNIIATREGHLLVAEDGGNLQAVVITASRQIAPLLQIPGDEGGSEITGLALSPDGQRLYFNSQRGGTIRIPIPAALAEALDLPLGGDTGGGKIYEIRRDDGQPIFS